MQASDHLHQLIRSLTMSEKRYFKIYASRHIIGNSNNYTRLFDAIALQEEYDEERLKKYFSGATFIRHLPSEKHYLYERVLESVNAANRHKSFLGRYSEILASIELLYNRGLFDQCKKLLRKAKQEAYSLEKLSVLYILVHWETILFINDEDEKNMRSSIAEELRLIDSLRIQTDMMMIAFDIQICIDKGSADKKYIALRKQKLKKVYPPPANLNSFWTKYYYFSALALLCTIENDNRGRQTCYEKIKEIMDRAPQFIRDLPAIYHLNYNNLVNILLYQRKFDDAEKLLHEQRNVLSRLRIRNPNIENRVFINTYESELYLNYKAGRYQKAADIAKSIETQVKKIGAAFGPIFYDLVYFLSISELLVRNYKGAIRWLNRILQAEEKISLRMELQINARLLYLVALHETGDVLFASRCKSTQRFMQNEPAFKKQRHLLRGIELAAGDLSQPKNRIALKSLLQLVKKEHQVAGEELLNKNFDFVEWIEAQLNSAGKG